MGLSASLAQTLQEEAFRAELEGVCRASYECCGFYRLVGSNSFARYEAVRTVGGQEGGDGFKSDLAQARERVHVQRRAVERAVGDGSQDGDDSQQETFATRGAGFSQPLRELHGAVYKERTDC
jgi:hypothetical protein